MSDANSFVASARHSWAELVHNARQIHPKQLEKSAKTLAEAAGVGAQGVREKLQAARWMLDAGRSVEDVIGLGQKQTIHEYRAARAEKRLDPLVTMSWRVTADLRYHVQVLVNHIAKVLEIRDSETFWMWWHAEASKWTEQEIRHSGGIPRLRKYAQTSSSQARRKVDHNSESE
jgi:hypothetical protein